MLLQMKIEIDFLKKGPVMKVMKVLIQHRKTKLYMNSGEWTDVVEKARDFERGNDAIEFAAKRKLVDVEIVYVFPESRYDFSVEFAPAT
jgi:hypothetical protein